MSSSIPSKSPFGPTAAEKLEQQQHNTTLTNVQVVDDNNKDENITTTTNGKENIKQNLTNEKNEKNIPSQKLYDDYSKGCRTCWHAFTRLCASTQFLTIIVTCCPSALIIGVIIYLKVGPMNFFAGNIVQNAAIVAENIVGGYVIAFAVATFLAAIFGIVCFIE